ncbi:MAG: site-specific integrase [Paenibacillaceae bacterium]
MTKLRYQSLLDGMKTLKYSKRTIELMQEASNLMFNKAVQMEMIKVSPAAGAEIPAFPETVEQLESDEELPKFLEKEELALLLRTAKQDDTIPGKQWYHALFVMAYTGLRLGELSSLKPTDIDEVNKQISVTKTLYDGGRIRNFGLNTPKTKSSIRKIDVSDTVLAILKKQDAWRTEFKMSVRDWYWEEETFIFVNDQQCPGYPAPRPQFEKRMRRSLIAAKLPETLTPHSLRHTYTSLMAEAGVELEAIQRLLGHKSDRVTRDIYLHVTKSKKEGGSGKIG